MKKKIVRLSKKTNVIFNIGSEKKFKTIQIYTNDPVTHTCYAKPFTYAYYDVEVEGSYKVPGWEFAASIEHTEKGNIIRSISDKVIPSKFHNCGPFCEHCGKIRTRKDTYIVISENGEFKQVGKQCVKDYTGMDAEVMASLASVYNFIKENESLPEGFIGSGPSYIEGKDFKMRAYAEVKANGYDRDNTIDRIFKNNTGVDESLEGEIAKIDEWVKSLNVENNDYLRNASVAWNLEYLEDRDLRLVASLIGCYLKDVEKKVQTSTSQYAGQIGDRVTIKVKSCRVLFTNSIRIGYDSYSCSYVYQIVGEDGNTYKWSTGNAGVEVGNTITASIKALNEYKGNKVTVITRGKVA